MQQRKSVCGVDEVGRGCLAGPVFAAAAILDLEGLLRAPLSTRCLIRDSKTLSARQRGQARILMEPFLLDHACGQATAAEIDTYGIVSACCIPLLITYSWMDVRVSRICCIRSPLLLKGIKSVFP